MALDLDTPQVRPTTLFALPEAWSQQTVGKAQYLPVIGVLLMLIAGSQVWAQGLFVLFVGIALWRKPPRATISRPIDSFSMLVAVIVLLTFLPYFLYSILPLRWLHQGSWRFQIVEADISSLFFYTPQPLLTLELFMLLLSALALIALLAHTRLYNAQRWRMAIALTLGLAVLAAAGLLGGITPDSAALLPAFKRMVFPNFGTAMAIGSLLSCALLFSAIRERWIGGAVLMTLCLCLTGTALALSGTGLWSWTALTAVFWIMMQIVRKRKVHGLLKTAFILVFLITATLVILGNAEGSDWILDNQSGTERIARYADSATIPMQQLAMGVGLGNFKYIFPFYQNRSLAQGQIDTPGNDWLLISAESGFFGLAAFGLLACALFLACFGKSRRSSAPIRQAATCALAVFFIGSILQSPGHYLGTVLLGILCLQLARPSLDNERKHSLYPRWLWKTQGVAFILVGLLWSCASLFNQPWQSDIAIQKAAKNLSFALAERDRGAVGENAASWLRFAPLASQPYMERGHAAITIDRDLIAAKADMNRALVLFPNQAELPLRQGILWLPHSKQEAEASFLQALQRHSDNPQAIYRKIVAASSHDRDFRRSLARLSQTNTLMRFVYLLDIPQNQFSPPLTEELRNDASLSRFSEEQRRQLIERWVREGNPRTAIRYLEEHPDVVPYPWYLHGVALAQIGSFKEASELFYNSLPMAQIPAILTSPRRRMEMPLSGFKLPPQSDSNPLPEALVDNDGLNHLQGASLLQQQLDDQQWAQAQRTATHLLTSHNSPAYAVYWSGKLHNDAGNHREAWPLLEKYAQHYLERRQQERATQLRGELLATPSLSSQAFERWEQIGTPAPEAPVTKAN